MVNIIQTQEYCLLLLKKTTLLSMNILIKWINFFVKKDQCEVCKEEIYSTNEKHGPLIDLRTLKISSAKINEDQKYSKFHIINGNLNLLGWVVLKSKNVIADKYDKPLAEMSIIKEGKYWQKLVNTDDERSIIFPVIIMFQDLKTMIFHFLILKVNILMITMCQMQHLEENYSFSKIDYTYI